MYSCNLYFCNLVFCKLYFCIFLYFELLNLYLVPLYILFLFCTLYSILQHCNTLLVFYHISTIQNLLRQPMQMVFVCGLAKPCNANVSTVPYVEQIYYKGMYSKLYRSLHINNNHTKLLKLVLRILYPDYRASVEGAGSYVTTRRSLNPSR